MYMLKDALISNIPVNLHVPLRYYSARFRGRLEPEMSYLNQLVGRRKRSIDIGANTGLYTYALAKLCDVVESFEPLPWVFKSTSAYIHSKVNFYNVGLSDHEGTLNINIPKIGDFKAGALASFRTIYEDHESLPVPVRTLDSYKFNDVSFIKIDVEGYEMSVIDGSVETINRCRPNLLIEIEQRHLDKISIDEVFSKIISLGYHGSFLSNGELVDISNFSVKQHQLPFIRIVEEKGRCKRYINNFLFFPSK